MIQKSTSSTFDTRSGNLISHLHQLLQVSFLSEAIFHLLEKSPPASKLLVVNHHDRYLSLSNETHYIYLLPLVNQELLNEIQQEMQFIPTRKRIVVQLEERSDLSMFEQCQTLSVQQIREQAVKDGVPEKNLYLLLMEQLFQHKYFRN